MIKRKIGVQLSANNIYFKTLNKNVVTWDNKQNFQQFSAVNSLHELRLTLNTLYFHDTPSKNIFLSVK
jgi:murein L,D-transpeptidase YcbB/YkuD